MARTALALQQIARAGLTPSRTAANTDGHSIANDGRMFVEVVNGAGAPITVTIVTPNTVDGLAITDRTVSVTNAETRMIGPFPRSTYNQSDATVDVNFSSITTITCAAYHL